MNNVADMVGSYVTGEWSKGGDYTAGRPSPTHDEIARLTYSLYEERGRQDGHPVEDWLRAEQELVGDYT